MQKNKKIVSFIVLFILIFLTFFTLFVFFQQRKNTVSSDLNTYKNKEALPTIDEYHNSQLKKIKLFESSLGESGSIDEYLSSKDKAVELFRYANALTRQHDFVDSDRASSTVKAITIYRKIAKSNLPNNYRAYALNEIYTAFVQSGSNLTVLKSIFSEQEIKNKMHHFNLGDDEKKLTSKDRLFLYQNLLADKEIKSITLSPTKIAIARIAMQDYINQLFFRTSLAGNKNNDSSNKDVIRIKKDFSEKVIKDYEKYKVSEPNILKPDTFSNVESKYLMAWSLNRAGVYTQSNSVINESYKLFTEGISIAESLKKTSNDFWGLSVITKIFYASAILGSNKNAYIDPEVVENRQRSLLILSELSSPEFITNGNYAGVRSYLIMMKSSNFDWITTLILLSKYDEGLKNNLKSLGWKI
jgi:hypothetical protein